MEVELDTIYILFWAMKNEISKVGINCYNDHGKNIKNLASIKE